MKAEVKQRMRSRDGHATKGSTNLQSVVWVLPRPDGANCSWDHDECGEGFSHRSATILEGEGDREGAQHY